MVATAGRSRRSARRRWSISTLPAIGCARAAIWPVGTWSLKGAFYAGLRKDGLRSGAEVDPPGYCHFGTWLDEAYFRQLASEYLAEQATRGRTHKFWKNRGGQRDNHWLDRRIMNMALAEHGLSSLTADEWAGRAKERGAPPDESLALLKTPNAPPPPSLQPAQHVPFPGLAELNASIRPKDVW
jgi:phage terminase large subunit GpA-like protein